MVPCIERQLRSSEMKLTRAEHCRCSSANLAKAGNAAKSHAPRTTALPKRQGAGGE